MRYLILFFILICVFISNANSEENLEEKSKANNTLDFSGGLIEGGTSSSDSLIDLNSNFKDLDEVFYTREDFLSYHEKESKFRFRYIEENL